MNLWTLVWREIRYRKFNFALAVLGVMLASGCVVFTLVLLRKHDLRTQVIIAAKEAETSAMMENLEEDFRKITVKMGFNVLILPKGQPLGDLYDDNARPKVMPEEYAEILAQNRVATINHVLPTLTQRVKWPEAERKILLMGIRGEVLIHGGKQKPILEAVPAGTLIVGYELHRSMHLGLGQKVKLLGREFTVGKLLDERGTWDDTTVWLDLKQAQELLDRQGQISSILALECNCAANRLDKIRAEIGALLPDTQVTEFASQALARAEARNRAAEQARMSLEQEKQNRERLRAEAQSFAALLLPLVVCGAAFWIALLALLNCRERRSETGIFRALGLRQTQVLSIFLLKALLIGGLGAGLGCLAGLLPTLAASAGMPLWSVVDWRVLAVVLLAGPGLSVLASWLPILWLVNEDPAVVLQEG